MISQAIWWATNLLMALLLVRAVAAGIFRHYPVFYCYLTYVLIESLVRFYAYTFHPASYARVYWSTQFLSVALGYCVLYEIYRQALAGSPGAGRLAQVMLLVVFAAILVSVLVASTGESAIPATEAPALLERSLRTVQAAFLILLVSVIVYYSIPVGPNLRGMILGYGLYVAASVISLTLRAHLGWVFQPWWQYFQPLAYLSTLLVWCISLWSYGPGRERDEAGGLESDYEQLASRTAAAITRARSYVMRAIRP